MQEHICYRKGGSWGGGTCVYIYIYYIVCAHTHIYHIYICVCEWLYNIIYKYRYVCVCLCGVCVCAWCVCVCVVYVCLCVRVCVDDQRIRTRMSEVLPKMLPKALPIVPKLSLKILSSKLATWSPVETRRGVGLLLLPSYWCRLQCCLAYPKGQTVILSAWSSWRQGPDGQW